MNTIIAYICGWAANWITYFLFLVYTGLDTHAEVFFMYTIGGLVASIIVELFKNAEDKTILIQLFLIVSCLRAIKPLTIYGLDILIPKLVEIGALLFAWGLFILFRKIRESL